MKILIMMFVTVSVYSQNVTDVYRYLVHLDVKHKEIVLSQIVLETGWFTSYSCKNRNNITGFTNNNGYYVYNTWKESVNHYKKWQDKYYKKGCYYSFLTDVGYAKDSIYVYKLKQLVGKLNKMIGYARKRRLLI